MQKRFIMLFKLLNETNNKIPCKILSNTLQVSERTIRTDISSINSILKKNGAVIKIKKGEGYYIDIFNLTLYQQYLSQISSNIIKDTIPNSPIERDKYILKHILYNTEYVKVEDLADMLYVSKITILNAIKRIKPILLKYNLFLISKPHYGIKIQGEETNIRKCISDNIISKNFTHYIMGITPEEIKLFEDIDLEELQSFISNEIIKFNISFSDFNLKNFIIHLAITITRIIKNCSLNTTDNITFVDFKPNDFVENVINYIEVKYNILISKSDRIYIYNHYATKSNSFSNRNTTNVEIITYVKNLLDVINTDYNFDLRNDAILFNDLIVHFKSILNSKYYNLNKVNPLINTIKNNYPLPFEISIACVEKIFKNSIYDLTEDEIGYVSLHIGAAIERLFQNNLNHKNIVLVCGSGHGTSRLLEAKLKKIFTDKINIIECLSFNEFIKRDFINIDLIISTIPIKHEAISVILVDLGLLKNDIENISKAISSDLNNAINSTINKFFDSKLFIINEEIKDKHQLLTLMYNKLYKNNMVPKEFLDSLFKRENLSSTNIDNFLAIPHPMELNSIQSKICVAILKNPIYWNNNTTVKMVFMLAINKDDYVNLDSIYDVLLKVINEDSIKNSLYNSIDFNDFISIVNKL